MLQSRLLDDLQDLALAESGRLVYHPAPTDLAELVRACRTAHAPAALAAGIRLEVETSGPVPAVVDQDRLRQVIGNLVTNAVRATPSGGLITLRAERDEECAVIQVADTGSGIREEDLPHVFDRFWRADNSRRRSTGGRGLGLAIAREIVAAHGGSITVSSEAGRGTEFTVRLRPSG
jgi:two-component system sensor histidine kinase BaeS